MDTLTQQRSNVENSLRCRNVGILNRISARAEFCMGQNFKLILEGWCLEKSFRVSQGDNKYAKILNEGPAPTPSQGVKHTKNSVPTSRIKEK